MKLEQVIYCLHALPALSNPPFFPSPQSFTLRHLIPSYLEFCLLCFLSPSTRHFHNRGAIEGRIKKNLINCSLLLSPEGKRRMLHAMNLNAISQSENNTRPTDGGWSSHKIHPKWPNGDTSADVWGWGKTKKRGRNGWERMVKGFQRAANCLPQSDKSTLFFLLFAFRIVGGIVCSKKNAFVQSELFFDGLPRGC